MVDKEILYLQSGTQLFQACNYLSLPHQQFQEIGLTHGKLPRQKVLKQLH